MRALFLGLFLSLAPSAHAAGTILTFDGTRSAGGSVQYWLTGSGMTQPLQYLNANGWTVVETSSITAQDLALADVCVIPSSPAGGTLSDTEFNALSQWLAGGGALLYQGDNDNFLTMNVRIAQLVGIQYAGQHDGTNVALTLAAPTHPLIQGPAGTVSALGGFNQLGKWSGLPPTATAVALNPGGTTALIAMTVGSGRAVITNDVNYFAYPPAYDTNHATLWANALAWLSASGGPAATLACFGDGTGTACPCANLGAAGRGCASSIQASGALLTGGGFASATLGNDTFVLAASGVPNGPGLYFQGTSLIGGGLGVPFGDGLRCVGGTLIRLGIVPAAANASTYPFGTTPPNGVPISQKGLVAAGDQRSYQLWYRDSAASFCTASVFNLTNAVSVTWSP